MKVYGGVAAQIHVFLNSALVGASSSPPLYPGERAASTHFIGDWAGPGTGPEDVERRKILPLPGLVVRHLGLLGRSQSLY
jgi:hypothetical protein